MSRANREPLEQRVVRAAEAALARQQYVSVIDVLVGMGLLSPNSVAAWRKGRIEFLEDEIQGNPEKIITSIQAFQNWAQRKALRPSEAQYVRQSPGGIVQLRFTSTGDAQTEAVLRTHFVSPELPECKRQKLDEPPEIVVFQIVRDSQCSECGTELPRDSFLLMEAGQPLCLACARLDSLEYVPAGDATLTRRATKYSSRKAVVVRFSRSRGRYERQGILAEAPAIEQAERECTEDAAERAQARTKAAEVRRRQDRAFVARMEERLATLFPTCPPQEVHAIAAHTALRGSGRVGRSAAGRNLEEGALSLAVAAAVRHQHTNYDELLAEGVDRALARHKVTDRLEEILNAWRR